MGFRDRGLPIDEFMRKLAVERSYDVYLNIYEGGEGESSGLNMVRLLESINLPFTGGDSKFFCITREHMQNAAERAGLNFVRGFNARTEADLEQAKSLCAGMGNW